MSRRKQSDGGGHFQQKNSYFSPETSTSEITTSFRNIYSDKKTVR